MSRDVTRGSGTLAEAPKLSPELAHILGKRKIVANYGGDDGLSSSGAEFRDGVWDRPEWVDQRESDEAAKALPSFEAMLRPPTQERIRDFLLMLWNATKHQGDMRWEAVETIYPMMLDSHPAWCFRPERLKLAAQHGFTWFPSVQELVAFMEPDRRAIMERVESLRKVSETPPPPPRSQPPGRRPWAQGGAEDQAQFLREKADRESKEMKEILAMRDAAQGKHAADPDPIVRGPGESDQAYVLRLRQRALENIDEGEKARRRDLRARERGIDLMKRELAEQEAQAAAKKPAPAPTPEQMAKANEAMAEDRVKAEQREFRKAQEHGPPPSSKAEKMDMPPADPDEGRLGAMVPDHETGDGP